MTIESNKFSRTQLIGIIATLRGSLYSIISQIEKPDEYFNDELLEAKEILEQTKFNLSSKDESNGGFDTSWRRYG